MPSPKKTGRDLLHTVLYVKRHIVSGPLPAKNVWFLVFLGLRACRGVTVSQCHSDMSGDMCIPTHIATAMSVSRVRIQ